MTVRALGLACVLAGCATISSPLIAPPANALMARSERIYVAIAGTAHNKTIDEVLVFSPGRNAPVETIRVGVSRPDALTFDGIGNLYVGNTTGTVAVYAPGQTKPSYSFGMARQNGWALAIDGSNNAYWASCPTCVNGSNPKPGNVSVYAPGKTRPSYTITKGAAYPNAIAVSHTGTLYVANCDVHYGCGKQPYPTFAGGFVSAFGPGKKTPAYTITDGISAPNGMVLDDTDNLYVANAGSHTVTVYAPGSKTPTYTIWANGGGVIPRFLAFDRAGNLYVDVASTIFVYAPGSSGEFAQLASVWGAGPMVFDDSGNLYVQTVDNGYVANPKSPILIFAPGAVTPTSIIRLPDNLANAAAGIAIGP
ncbi:MAG: hypothetical protein JO277_05700 [Candidatus Eremiobacteraeota bacterium]|nr:hypothetical protein [Candidatus Eremiobacteraeota bacterium]